MNSVNHLPTYISNALRRFSYALPLILALTINNAKAQTQNNQQESSQSISLNPQSSLKIGVETIIDLAQIEITKAYKDNHITNDCHVQINMIDSQESGSIPNSYNGETIGEMINARDIGMSKLLQISINNKVVKLKSKEGAEYKQIISQIAGGHTNECQHNGS